MPFTAWYKISSALLKASRSVKFFPPILRSLWLGTAIRVSTIFRNSEIPSSAWRFLLFPSNWNGLVTIATVSIPSSLAISATTGAPPVPVPPPKPAVIKTMSAPSSCPLIRSLVSKAALFPTSGFEPAPNPFVTSAPNCNFTGDRELLKACASVLATIKSTPLRL